jgi:hypothetical protein
MHPPDLNSYSNRALPYSMRRQTASHSRFYEIPTHNESPDRDWNETTTSIDADWAFTQSLHYNLTLLPRSSKRLAVRRALRLRYGFCYCGVLFPATHLAMNGRHSVMSKFPTHDIIPFEVCLSEQHPIYSLLCTRRLA